MFDHHSLVCNLFYWLFQVSFIWRFTALTVSCRPINYWSSSESSHPRLHAQLLSRKLGGLSTPGGGRRWCMDWHRCLWSWYFGSENLQEPERGASTEGSNNEGMRETWTILGHRNMLLYWSKRFHHICHGDWHWQKSTSNQHHRHMMWLFRSCSAIWGWYPEHQGRFDVLTIFFFTTTGFLEFLLKQCDQSSRRMSMACWSMIWHLSSSSHRETIITPSTLDMKM